MKRFFLIGIASTAVLSVISPTAFAVPTRKTASGLQKSKPKPKIATKAKTIAKLSSQGGIPKPAVTAPMLKIGVVHAPTAQGLKGAEYQNYLQRLQTAAKAEGAVFVVDDKAILYKTENQSGLLIVDLTPSVRDLLPTEAVVAEQKAAEQKNLEAQAERQAREQKYGKLALEALRRLTVDVQDGIPRQSYFAQVELVRREVNENLLEVPAGNLKTQIEDILQVYENGSEWWYRMDKAVFPRNFLVSMEGQQLIEKYDLQISGDSIMFEKVYDNKATTSKYITSPLKQIWTVAREKLEFTTKVLADIALKTS